jgi:O-succinylhomoserine sulfhydrylase
MCWKRCCTRYGVKVTFVDGADLDQWRAAVTPGTKAVFFESMSNPTLELVDIRAVSEIAHAAGALVIVRQRVCHADLFARGRTGRRCGGLFHHQAHRRAGPGAGRRGLRHRDFIRKTLEPYMKHTGGSHEPLHRLDAPERHGDAGPALPGDGRYGAAGGAGAGGAPEGGRVIYPGLPSHPQHGLAMAQMGSGGTLVTFEVKGGKEARSAS